LFEKEFVQQLTVQGIEAMAGHTVLSSDTVPKYDALIALAKENNADAVLVTRFQGIAQDKGPALKQGEVTLAEAWRGYYDQGYTALPAYAWKRERYELVTVLYEVDTERPLWKIETELVADGPVAQSFEPLVRIMATQLRADRMVR